MPRVFAVLWVRQRATEWERAREKSRGSVCVCVAAEKPSNCRLSHVCHINSTLDWRRSTEQVKNYYYLAAAPSKAAGSSTPLPTLLTGNHSPTQHLLSSGSSECFGPRVRKSISFMFFCWNFMGDRSSFSLFFDQREWESAGSGCMVGSVEMDRAATKNFFWQRCSFR